MNHMIRVSQLKLSIPHTKEQLEKKAGQTASHPPGGTDLLSDPQTVTGCEKETGAFLCLYSGCKSEK